MTDFGHDLACLQDEDLAQSEVSGLTVLLQALARRLQTPFGTLLGDPTYGYDLVGELDGDVGPQDAGRIAATVDAEFRKDPRVRSSTSTVTMVSNGVGGYTMTLTSGITVGDGPFTTVVFAIGQTVGIVAAYPGSSTHT